MTLALFGAFILASSAYAVCPPKCTLDDGVIPDTGFGEELIEGKAEVKGKAEALPPEGPGYAFESVTVSKIIDQIFKKIRGRLVAVKTVIGSHTEDIFGSIQDLIQTSISEYTFTGQLAAQTGRVEGTFSSNGGLTHGTIYGSQSFEIGAGGLAMLDKSSNIQEVFDELLMTHTVTLSNEDRANDRATGVVDPEATTGGSRTFTNNLNWQLIDPAGDPTDPANRRMVDGYEVMTLAETVNDYAFIAGDIRVILATTDSSSYNFETETTTTSEQSQETIYHPVTGQITGGGQRFTSVQTSLYESCGANNECLIWNEAGTEIIDTTLSEATYTTGNTTLALTYAGNLVATDSLAASVSFLKDPELMDFSELQEDPERGATQVSTSIQRQHFDYRRLADGTLTGRLEDARGTVVTDSRVLRPLETGPGYDRTGDPLSRTTQNTTMEAIVVNNQAVFNDISTTISGVDNRPGQDTQRVTSGTSRTILAVDMTTGAILEEGSFRDDVFETGNAAGGGIAQWGYSYTRTESHTVFAVIGNEAQDRVTTSGSLTLTKNAAGEVTALQFNGNVTTTAYNPLKGVASIDLARTRTDPFDGPNATFEAPPTAPMNSLSDVIAYCAAGNCVQGANETNADYAARLFFQPLRRPI